MMLWGKNRQQWPEEQGHTEFTFYCVSSNCTGTPTLCWSVGAHEQSSPIALDQNSDEDQTWAMKGRRKKSQHKCAWSWQYCPRVSKVLNAQRELWWQEEHPTPLPSLSSPALFSRGLTVPSSIPPTWVLFLWDSLSPDHCPTAAHTGKLRYLNCCKLQAITPTDSCLELGNPPPLFQGFLLRDGWCWLVLKSVPWSTAAFWVALSGRRLVCSQISALICV